MTDNVTAAELRQFVERIESIDGDIREYQETRKEVYAEAKSRGYSTPIMREIIRLRKLRPDDRAERDAVLTMYLEALGMA
jgi:uncharacterized protein (UPF0335 family)